MIEENKTGDNCSPPPEKQGVHHIRPKIRSRKQHPTKTIVTTSKDISNQQQQQTEDKILYPQQQSHNNNYHHDETNKKHNVIPEPTRLKMEGWIGMQHDKTTNHPSLAVTASRRSEEEQPSSDMSILETPNDSSTMINNQGSHKDNTHDSRTKMDAPKTNFNQQTNPTKSILRTPKYTTRNETAAISSSCSTNNETEKKNNESAKIDAVASTEKKEDAATEMFSGLVVERTYPSPKQQLQQQGPSIASSSSSVPGTTSSLASAISIEGYEPDLQPSFVASSSQQDKSSTKGKKKHTAKSTLTSTSKNKNTQPVEGGETRNSPQAKEDTCKDNNNNKDEDEETDKSPLILSSISDLMEAAGTLPTSQDIKDAKVIEAEISFTCMSPEEYETHKQMLEQLEEKEQDAFQNNKEKTDKKTGLDTNSTLKQKPEQKVTFDSLPPDSMTVDEEERQSEVPVTVSDDEEEGENDQDENNIMNEDDDDNESLLDLFDIGSDDDDDDEEDDNSGGKNERQQRAFGIIHETLMIFVTPEACDYLNTLKQQVLGDDAVVAASASTTTTLQKDTENPAVPIATTSSSSITNISKVPSNDIEASRCAGFLTMLKMHIIRAIDEIGYNRELLRTIDQRLTCLIYTFDYSVPTPKLNTNLWKAFTCIMIEVVLVEYNYPTSNDKENTAKINHPNSIPNTRKKQYPHLLPQSIEEVGMCEAEYHYLIEKGISVYNYHGII